MPIGKGLLNYYRNQNQIKKEIEKDAREDKHIIYGGQAINRLLPKHLNRPTKDYDLFAKNSKREARETERKLDRRFKGNYFDTEKGSHKGTYRVRSKVDGEVVADYTKPERKVPAVKRDGLRYATLEFHKRQLRKSIRDKRFAHRHAKDRDSLQRIELFEKYGG